MSTLLKTIPVLALLCASSLAYAQQAVTLEEGHLPKKDKPLESRGLESGVFMQDGKMMTMKDGIAQPMTAPMTMNNGTKVMTDGSVTMANGKAMMLHNGQYVRLDGSVTNYGSMKDKKPNRKSL